MSGSDEVTTGRPSPAQPAPGARVADCGADVRVDLPALCARVRLLLEAGDVDVVECDVGALDADAVTVDALARLQLTARRLGARVVLRHASDELRSLLAWMGLDGALTHARLPVEPQRQVEQREQACGVEERVEPDDPAV